MSNSSPGEDRPKKRPLTPSEYAALDCDLQQAKIAAHQAYLAGLNPDSLKAEDARRQIQLLREELQIKLDRAGGG